MTKLFLVRHGRSTANAAGILAGHQSGVSLDEVGRKQAQALAERFPISDIKAIISSPMQRCQETAKFLADRLGMEIATDDRFTEMDFGIWQGQALKDLMNEPLWPTVQNQPSQMRFPEGETFQEVGLRAVAGINHWNELFESGSYVVFSHADVIKVAVAQLIGLPLDHFQRIAIDPCSVTVLEYTSEKVVLRALNVQVEFLDSMVAS